MTAPSDFAAIVAGKGFVVLYRRHGNNACPSCGKSNWIVGRTSAECAFCQTALPLAEPVSPELQASLERTER